MNHANWTNKCYITELVLPSLMTIIIDDPCLVLFQVRQLALVHDCYKRKEMTPCVGIKFQTRKSIQLDT